jgi:serine/threonine-protein kinase RsbW
VTEPADPDGVEGTVRLEVPAASAFVAVLRSVTAGLAARCDLTLDEIEDLRIAVDEACALLLPLALGGAALATVFTLSPGELTFSATVPVRPGVALRRDGFGWTVLEALATEVDVDERPDAIAITLTKRREPAPQ